MTKHHRQSQYGLDDLGLAHVGTIHWNLPVPALYEQSIRRNEAVVAQSGPLVALTGAHTGRSPNDKFIVKEASTEADIWWGKVNRPISEEHFDRVFAKVQAYIQGREVFVRDCYAGADPEFRLRVRVVTENAWHNLFARNMFISAEDTELRDFVPEFTVIDTPGLLVDPQTDGTSSGGFILVHFGRKLAVIGGTSYAGEIKKSIFSVLNYLLPARGVFPMHCSANIGEQGDAAVYFGLSGTGKTTLSADPRRTLIGDDEHGWSDKGVFNFEGGCYAKVIKLSEEAEPQIYGTTRRFGTILENVVMDPATRRVDLDDGFHTENTRASYPLGFIDGASATGTGGHPRNIFLLTCDAFGVLPPISRLTTPQAMYHFLSGYTAKVAGTEKGVKDPTATFSSCFGAPFLPRYPSVYASMLGERIRDHDACCWLVNTGWTGGPFGVGHRMKIAHTRATLEAALTGGFDAIRFEREPHFGLDIPVSCPGVPDEVLRPHLTWEDKDAYARQARKLSDLFAENFRPFEDKVSPSVRAAAPRA
ncbi:MAG: phosphoenolpyruvate carboxykinase [Planctomycetota bacterium]|jgi:phosphoenolpyruvate carboxykinase (ATP)